MWLRLFIEAVRTGAMADPRLPVGDVGLVVGESSQDQALGLSDRVALCKFFSSTFMA